MLGEEHKKLNLMLAYKICQLYVNSGASSSSISAVTNIPLPTVKRNLQAIEKEKNNYLKFFPDFMTEEELLSFQAQIVEVRESNKKLNKWRNDKINFSDLQEDIDEIKALYKFSRMTVSEETKSKIRNLRVNGFSFREIVKKTGVSLSHTHKIATENINKAKGK